MRQRKVKNLEGRILDYQHNFVKSYADKKGGWSEIFVNKNELYLEFGAGKGIFLIKQAEKHRDRNYIGIEGQASVVFRALEKLEATGLGNVRFICEFVNEPQEFFAEAEVDGIYLNFSDPWPKARHANRRLTHRKYLAQYHKILKEGGAIELKTDNEALFEFTVGEVHALKLYEVVEITRDLHNSSLKAANITTEYEDKFKAAGKNIHYMKLIKLN